MNRKLFLLLGIALGGIVFYKAFMRTVTIIDGEMEYPIGTRLVGISRSLLPRRQIKQGEVVIHRIPEGRISNARHVAMYVAGVVGESAQGVTYLQPLFGEVGETIPEGYYRGRFGGDNEWVVSESDVRYFTLFSY